mgnify:FL=1
MKKYFFPLVKNPYRSKDIFKAIKVLKTGKLTMGTNVSSFEKEFTSKLKTNYSLMVNSGSSANLLAIQCLINPYRKKRLKIGDEIIIPSLCWSTSLWPIVQSGLKPIFVDIDKETLNINLADLEKKITKKTKGIMLVHVLGNSTDMTKLMKIKKKYKLILIEDTCESLGAQYKNKFLGTFGEFSSYSFYASHQISSGEGGMICCKDKSDYEIIKSLRSHGWSRNLSNERKISNNNPHLDKRFIFYNSGFNLRPTEIAGAIGRSQFKDLFKFKKIRNLNRKNIINLFKKDKKINRSIKVIKPNKNVNPSWFGLPLIVNKKNLLKKLMLKLEKNGIETRPIISGNFLKQPSVKKYGLIKNIKFRNADYINNHGFFIGLPFDKIKINILKKIERSFQKSV